MIIFVIRILPFILIPVLLLGGLWYFRNLSSNQTQNVAQVNETESNPGPVEVPKTAPGATIDERVASLETAVGKIVPQINSLKSSGSYTTGSSAVDSKISNLESAVTNLEARIAILEKTTPSVTPVSQSTIYIPMGSASGPWTNTDWSLLGEYEISLNPSNYPGYTGMSLEVNYRMVDPTGTGSIRLYNVTDSSVVSSQLDTNSTSFGLLTTSTYKLASGQKTYKLQIKSTGGKELYIQSARVKVSF